MNIIIDGNKINNIEELHEEFKESLNLNDDYGMNLDALNDVLFEFKDLHVTFINSSKLVYNIEKYFFRLLDVLKNNNVEVNIKVNK